MSFRSVFRIVSLLLTITGFLLVVKAQTLSENLQDASLAFGLPFFMWAFSIFYIAIDDPDFTDYFRQDGYFLKLTLWFGAIMLTGGFFFLPIMDTPLWDRRSLIALPGVLLIIGGMLLMLFLIEKHIKAIQGIEPEETPFLKYVLFGLFHVPMPFLFKILLPLQTENLLNPVLFYLILIPICIALASVYSIFFKNLWLQDIQDQGSYQLVVWLLSSLILLIGLAYYNRHPFDQEVQTRNVLVQEKSESDRKIFISFTLDDKLQKFHPNRQEWESIQPRDSIRITIQRGALGFDFIENFKKAQK